MLFGTQTLADEKSLAPVGTVFRFVTLQVGTGDLCRPGARDSSVAVMSTNILENICFLTIRLFCELLPQNDS
jgi:hypothetical protein